MEREQFLRKQLADLLRGRGSHATLEEAVDGFTPERRGAVPPGVPYSAWMLMEHIRAVQGDFINTIRDPVHASPKWPEGFWPAAPEPPDPGSWERSVTTLKADLEAMAALVEDPSTDITESRPWMEGWTIMRLVMLAVDHIAYHLGEIVLLRRIMGIWQVQG